MRGAFEARLDGVRFGERQRPRSLARRARTIFAGVRAVPVMCQPLPEQRGNRRSGKTEPENEQMVHKAQSHSASTSASRSAAQCRAFSLSASSSIGEVEYRPNRHAADQRRGIGQKRHHGGKKFVGSSRRVVQ